MKRLVFGSILCLLSSGALGARVNFEGVNASSSFPVQNGVRYDASQLNDGKLSSCWVEGDSGSGLGSWFEVNLGGEKSVDSLKVWAGMWYSYDYWSRANRPKSIEVKFSDGSVETHSLTDKMEAQFIQLKSTHKTSTIRIKIKDIYKGTTWFDTVISEIQVFDKAAAKHVEISQFGASSELPEDGDGNYNPKNVDDGINDSMWCEGNKEGDGTGEWLSFGFAGNPKVGSVTLVNGIGSSMMVWMKGNRALEATLQFNDGSSETVAVKNSFRTQTIDFQPRTTTGVKLTFTKVMKGKEYNDLCVSEVLFK